MANGSFKEEIAERINTGIVSQLVRDAHKSGKCLRRGKYAYLKKNCVPILMYGLENGACTKANSRLIVVEKGFVRNIEGRPKETVQEMRNLERM